MARGKWTILRVYDVRFSCFFGKYLKSSWGEQVNKYGQNSLVATQSICIAYEEYFSRYTGISPAWTYPDNVVLQTLAGHIRDNGLVLHLTDITLLEIRRSFTNLQARQLMLSRLLKRNMGDGGIDCRSSCPAIFQLLKVRLLLMRHMTLCLGLQQLSGKQNSIRQLRSQR